MPLTATGGELYPLTLCRLVMNATLSLSQNLTSLFYLGYMLQLILSVLPRIPTKEERSAIIARVSARVSSLDIPPDSSAMSLFKTVIRHER